jgi:uncharacterized membrane protein YdcZ (DUF606 family)
MKATEVNNAKPWCWLALPDHSRLRRAAGLGAADERRVAQRARQSMARQRRFVSPILFLLGAVFLCLPRPLPTADGITGMPWWAPLGGVIGAFAVVAGLLFVGKVGAGVFGGLTITANILMSLAIDHFGLFRLPVHQFGSGGIIGAALMVAGIALISRS